jgi:hypothetical protein
MDNERVELVATPSPTEQRNTVGPAPTEMQEAQKRAGTLVVPQGALPNGGRRRGPLELLLWIGGAFFLTRALVKG